LRRLSQIECDYQKEQILNFIHCENDCSMIQNEMNDENWHSSRIQSNLYALQKEWEFDHI
jgi:hypothetical protein